MDQLWFVGSLDSCKKVRMAPAMAKQLIIHHQGMLQGQPAWHTFERNQPNATNIPASFVHALFARRQNLHAAVIGEEELSQTSLVDPFSDSRAPTYTHILTSRLGGPSSWDKKDVCFQGPPSKKTKGGFSALYLQKV